MTAEEYKKFYDSLTPFEREHLKILREMRDLLKEIADVGRD